MLRTHALPLLCFLGTALLSPPTFADVPAAPPAQPTSKATKEKARQLFRDGTKAYTLRRWADARAAYAEAFALDHDYWTAGNLADAEMQLELYRDAAAHLAFVMREITKDAKATDSDREIGDKKYKEALKLAKVGAVVVSVDVDGAELYVDGKNIGKSPLVDPVFLDPGEHLIEARAEGSPTARKQVDVVVGTQSEVKVEPPPTPTPPPKVDAVVEKQSKPLTVKGTETVKIEPLPPPGGGPNKAIVIGGAALTGAGILLGTGLAIGSNVKAPCSNDTTRPAPEQRRCEHERVLLANASFDTFIVAGAIGVGTLIYALVSRRSASAKNGVVPATAFVGPKLGGVVVTTRW